MSSGSSDLRRRLAGRIGMAAATGSALFLLALPALGTGLLVSPGSILASVPAGAELTRQIILTPTDPRPTRVRVSVEPFALDADGRPDHGPGRTPAGSRVDRLEVNPRELLLENGDRGVVEVRWLSPREASGSSWAVVLLEIEPVRVRGKDGGEADVIARFAVPVFLTVEGTERPELRIEEITAALTTPGRIELDALLENLGNTVVRASGGWSAEVGSYEIASEDLKDVLILPGSPRRVHGVLRGDFKAAGPISGHLWIRFGSGAGRAVQAECPVERRPAGEQEVHSNQRP